MTDRHPNGAITIAGDLLTVRFDRFDLAAYDLFLKVKKLPEKRVAYDWRADRYDVTTPARFAPLLGLPAATTAREGLPLPGHLFDYQAWAVGLALAARRYALWLDTGLGKTAVYLEWCRQVLALSGGRVLIVAPLAVIPQVIAEAARFYGDRLAPIHHLRSREDLVAWLDGSAHHRGGLAITNYEKFVPGQLPELRHLAGIVADESSALKTGGGTIKWNLIHSAKGIPWKLSCTATPAPNQPMEYASQAAFLETLKNEQDIIWTWFEKRKDGTWEVKPHAKAAFYRWMSSWSLYMRDPARFGFGDILASLPEPEYRDEVLALTADQARRRMALLAERGRGMFGDRIGVQERAKLAQMARGFVYRGKATDAVEARKPARVAEIVRDEVSQGRQTLVWTTFDHEGEIIARLLDGAGFPFAVLSGATREGDRLDTIARFRAGDLAAVISKPQLLGYGLNLQFVRAMVFSGLDDSFERRYQAIRRAVRFGQTETVRVWTPYVPELEGMLFENVAEKERRFMEEVAAQEDCYREALASMRTEGEAA